MFIKLFNYSIEVSFRSRWPWTHMKLHRYGVYSHFVWGKLSILYGQPHLVEVEVCKFCSSEVEHIGEDGISYCEEGCGIVEGDTETITMEEYEKRHA
jgi:hypothetical protein